MSTKLSKIFPDSDCFIFFNFLDLNLQEIMEIANSKVPLPRLNFLASDRTDNMDQPCFAPEDKGDP